MRANVLLATVFALLGLLLGVLFFVFVNVQIPIEPLATWSDTLASLSRSIIPGLVTCGLTVDGGRAGRGQVLLSQK